MAGRILNDTSAEPTALVWAERPQVFLVDPGPLAETYGGEEAWARCVRGYVNARGYGASVSVAGTAEEALAAAEAKWGITVERSSRDGYRESTAVGIKAVPHTGRDARMHPGAPLRQSAHALRSSVGTVGAVRSGLPGQLGLPGIGLGRSKRRASKPVKKVA